MKKIVVIVLFTLLLVISCAEKVEVTNKGLVFTPNEVTINAGEVVRFKVGSSHNVQEVEKETWDKGEEKAKEDGFSVPFGGTKEVTFDKPGTYYYVCQPHVDLGMKGKVIVE